MIFHYYPAPEWLEPIAKIGWSGVDLFFVLSGFLIGSQLLNEFKKNNNISFRNFYVKRFFRIIPTYLVVLLIYYLLPNLREGSGMAPLWKYLTFTQNIGFDVANSSSFSHAWSLCIEEQFYLLLPILILSLFAIRLQTKAGYIIIGLVILGILLRVYNWNEYVQPLIDINKGRKMARSFFENIYYPSYNRMDGLLVGISVAAIFTFKPKIKQLLINKGNYFLLLGIVLFLLAFQINENLISYNNAVYGFPLISIAYGSMVIAALSPVCFLYKLKSKITFFIATLSYSIYLTHKLIFHIIKSEIINHELDLDPNLTFGICMFTAVIIGLLLHLTIERSFLKLRERILDGNKKRKKKLSSNTNYG
ncbi:Peptidoglycan/LPS O-acetylase OafA/YrhL, contains acyltransferase and SGNH-hydrolase domains [Marivirga sericea]|uniref:Peptidoglycan/LPS O-acetylase OafA/YrhL, contains acyltransferase and SGNH-hydrolase domains n=2 Tax=Marivirga sericea TaxID=1028 RepID=A0A1X7KZ14_9BACT|nr:Peptidoglycan/LPS O-acetylase OafA/YrhL, contains acyltransferase and SGNH-hydrolase domains [Marivirga sericea]